jgi:predicted metal-dependent phosphoesterase TrpH
LRYAGDAGLPGRPASDELPVSAGAIELAHTLMKLDLHVHCRERSPCGQAPECEQIVEAIDRGLDAIAFTDHHHLVPSSRLKALNECFAPFRVFNGAETSADGEDLLVFGVRNRRLERLEWRYPELYDFVRSQGGFLVLAHPYRFGDQLGIDIRARPPDAIEWHSNNIAPDTHARIAALAEEHNLPLICASDAHHTFALGRHYIDVAGTPADAVGLFELIRTRNYSCHG